MLQQWGSSFSFFCSFFGCVECHSSRFVRRANSCGGVVGVMFQPEVVFTHLGTACTVCVYVPGVLFDHRRSGVGLIVAWNIVVGMLVLLYIDGWCDNEHVSAAVRYSYLPGSHERSGRRFTPARANLARMRCLQFLEVAFFLSLTLQQMLYVSCDFDRLIIVCQ